MKLNKVPTLRIHSVNRISLDMQLIKHLKKLKPGVVLDVGSSASPYKKFIPATKYLRLDINKESHPDICCDVHQIEWASKFFNTIIASEVLEHLANPAVAIEEMRRVLKSGGICILTTRFMYPYHPCPKDYYRFTKDSLQILFSKFSTIQIVPHGNRIQLLWQIINNSGNKSCGKLQRIFNIFLNIFNPIFARINFIDKGYPLGFIVVAQK